jgi:squalene-hopene/tetraprenyl-beta-curcumene cyclase
MLITRRPRRRIVRSFLRAGLAALAACVPTQVRAESNSGDPYHLLPAPGSTQDTADEPFSVRFSAEAAAAYLDARAHLVEKNCFACHSTFTYLPARSVLEPLAGGVMETRLLLERFTALCLDKAKLPLVKTQHIGAVRILAAVELARHDAATTGRLQPVTRAALDSLWQLQRADGGVKWLHVGEAPQAVDDYWPVAMIALGAGSAPEGYGQTAKAMAGIEKLRGWFRSHPAKDAHGRALTLLAHASIGGILSDAERRGHTEELFALQHDDGGWSLAGLADWQRPDKRPLDSSRSDGYGTGFVSFVLARSGVAPSEPRLRKGIDWLKANQRRSGGWFTPSPFKRDMIASNTGTSFAVQALAACGEIQTPKVSAEAFAAAHAAADEALPPGVYLPGATPSAPRE